MLFTDEEKEEVKRLYVYLDNNRYRQLGWLKQKYLKDMNYTEHYEEWKCKNRLEHIFKCIKDKLKVKGSDKLTLIQHIRVREILKDIILKKEVRR